MIGSGIPGRDLSKNLLTALESLIAENERLTKERDELRAELDTAKEYECHD
jgi:hypothetical protein